VVLELLEATHLIKVTEAVHMKVISQKIMDKNPINLNKQVIVRIQFIESIKLRWFREWRWFRQIQRVN